MVSGLLYKLENGVVCLKHKHKQKLGLSTKANPILALDVGLINFFITVPFG